MQTGGLLALDLATNLGWCYFAPDVRVARTRLERMAGPPENFKSGSYRVKGVGIGPFLSDYRIWLTDMIGVFGPGGVVFEAPWVRTGDNSGKRTTSPDIARKLFGLAGLTEMVSHDLDIRLVRECHVGTVKKHFAGHGRAEKAETIQACREMGFDPKNDDEADAIAVAHYAWSILKR